MNTELIEELLEDIIVAINRINMTLREIKEKMR